MYVDSTFVDITWEVDLMDSGKWNSDVTSYCMYLNIEEESLIRECLLTEFYGLLNRFSLVQSFQLFVSLPETVEGHKFIVTTLSAHISLFGDQWSCIHTWSTSFSIPDAFWCMAGRKALTLYGMKRHYWVVASLYCCCFCYCIVTA